MPSPRMTDDSSSQPSSPGTFTRWKQLGERLIHSKNMLWGVGLASFLEALIIPIPLETILLPLMQARRRQMFVISTVVLITCLLAAVVGYGVGRFVFDAMGPQLISLFSSPEQFEQVRQEMETKGFWFVFSVGIIPIPFQIAMLAAGATQYPLWSFLLASALSRGIRYYGLAVLVLMFGNRAQKLFERHKKSVSIALLLIALAAWGISTFA